MFHIELYTASFIFLAVFLVREFVAYKKILVLKYFFTPLLTFMLVLMMIYSISINGSDKYRVFILLSLLSALVADTLLMIEEVDLLKNGMIYFIIGHVFYVFAFSGDITFKPWNIFLIAVLAVLSFLYIRVLMKTAGSMIIPVISYVLILDLMVYFALTKLNNGLSASGIIVASGALLFMISDFILSINAFVKPVPNSTVYTWLLYAPAQFLFVLSTFVD
jgi:uncharacterized membrane protein YhhN